MFLSWFQLTEQLLIWSRSYLRHFPWCYTLLVHTLETLNIVNGVVIEKTFSLLNPSRTFR